MAEVGGAPAFSSLPTRKSSIQVPVRTRRIPYGSGQHKTLLTNQEGQWVLLSDEEFGRYVSGDVDEASSLFARLKDRNFLRDHYDVPKAVAMLRGRKEFVHYGPNLHIAVITLRCNETCVYCHASRANMDALHTDMGAETIERTVDMILRSTNPYVTIEFQGGEPLVNFDGIRHLIDYAREKNKAVGKQLEFTMVSNLALMDDEKLDYLLENKVQICTSIDGPPEVHDKQRKLPTASSHDKAVYWVKRINQRYEEIGLDPTLYRVEALLTTTRATLTHFKRVVDSYVDLGCRALFLRPLDPFGFAEKTAHKIEYPREEYMEFYRQAVDYMIELNKGGVQILERYAAIFLTKILRGEDPNFLDIRWPSGAGIGQLAYNYDGKIFTCDEGRMLHEMGDDTFYLGDVRTSSYREIVGHPTVRAVALASNLEQNPDCVSCSYLPYCGIPPVHSHKTQGTIFGRMRESTLCHVHKHIQDYLFAKIAEEDPETLDILEKWTTSRPRTHFMQDS
ncbi:MAG: His-Xaa-Ser system radical SAM maturase HxsB [Myxococcota bacterium]